MKMDNFDLINPTDFRYYAPSKEAKELLGPYLSENAMISYMARAEGALAQTLAEFGFCSKKVASEISKAAELVKAADVYGEEARIKHNVRALANIMRNHVSDDAKPYVHFTATSHDIICSADSARYKDAALNAVLPVLKELEKILISIARREKATLQIGRTHGQHAEPITFGFAMAEYVSRLGTRILAIEQAANNLKGKLSGAVGAYNQSGLFFDDPEKFEKAFLAKLGLLPATHSTQIAEPEPMADYMHAITTAFGVLASLSDDMRHLQRTEIAEVGEEFAANQVGSSTMPHKRNPINFENVKSMWKTFMPRMVTMYLDQPSEHQRDLTNSASSRYHAETVAALVLSAKRLIKVLSRLVVDKSNLQRNFDIHAGLIPAEPLYLLLAAYGHPDAHEKSRQLTLESQKTGKTVVELARSDSSLTPYLEKMTSQQKDILDHPEWYTGIAAKKAESVCRNWEKRLGI